jgi:hypothetical protein
VAAVEYTEFWVACAAAGPVLLIPTYLLVRQERAPGSPVRSGLSVASVAFLAAGTILALVVLSNGPVHGGRAGRIIELVLICGPVATLVLPLMRTSGSSEFDVPPQVDEAGFPDLPD